MNEVELNVDNQGAVLLTQEGFKALQEELEALTQIKRPEIAARIRESQEHGEFSEDNSELDEVKFEQAIVETRIGELKAIFGNAQTIPPESIPTDYVGLGSRVTVEDAAFNDEFQVRVVSTLEADPEKDQISNESPMGAALYGRRGGEVVTFDAPDGKKRLKIVQITR
jgi:transcription elongation factor GreA